MFRSSSTSTEKKRSEGIEQASLWKTPGIGERSQNRLVHWWYQLAAPREPEHATPADRERVRAGRLGSLMLLIMFCFELAQVPNALVSTNPFFLPFALIAIAVNIGVFVLNRQGAVLVAGIILVVVVETAFVTIISTSPLGLSARSLSAFYLLVLTELMAVCLLPPASVFLLAGCNVLFTWAAISFLPHASDFQLLTPTAYYSALAGPLTLQVVVALVTYLWATGAKQAIARAERLAALERALAERDREEAAQKQQLEQGIEQILQTHILAANGNLDVRAPLARENVLWRVAYSLNNLLARLKLATSSERELERTKGEVRHLIEGIRQTKARRTRLQVAKNGTLLDPLIQELTGTSLDQY
jgi:hypothetical protein